MPSNKWEASDKTDPYELLWEIERKAIHALSVSRMLNHQLHSWAKETIETIEKHNSLLGLYVFDKSGRFNYKEEGFLIYMECVPKRTAQWLHETEKHLMDSHLEHKAPMIYLSNMFEIMGEIMFDFKEQQTKVEPSGQILLAI